MIVGEKRTIHEKITLKGLKGKIICWGNAPRKLTEENSYGVPGSDFYCLRSLNLKNG